MITVCCKDRDHARAAPAVFAQNETKTRKCGEGGRHGVACSASLPPPAYSQEKTPCAGVASCVSTTWFQYLLPRMPESFFCFLLPGRHCNNKDAQKNCTLWCYENAYFHLMGFHRICLSTSSVNPPNPGPYDLSLSNLRRETTATAPMTGINSVTSALALAGNRPIRSMYMTPLTAPIKLLKIVTAICFSRLVRQ